MGTPSTHIAKLRWEALGLPRRNLSALEEPFTEEELRVTVHELHGEKAPGPDGFTGTFFKRCWSIVKDDLLLAVNCAHALRGRNWNLLNTANIVLLPKKEDAQDCGDYRPISLMHSVQKILSKLLVARLAPEIQHLVSNNQSAFIQGRSIQDNFLYVRNVLKVALVANSPMVFLKLDVAKAFDSVGWAYLLEVLEDMGFGQRWWNLISLVLSSSSSRVLLNGAPGKPFVHRQGLRQGDPMSPLMFISAMEPLQRLLTLATERLILSPLRLRFARSDAAYMRMTPRSS